MSDYETASLDEHDAQLSFILERLDRLEADLGRSRAAIDGSRAAYELLGKRICRLERLHKKTEACHE